MARAPSSSTAQPPGGPTARVGSYPLSGDTEREVDLPLKGFGDGGWYWFDLVAVGRAEARRGGLEGRGARCRAAAPPSASRPSTAPPTAPLCWSSSPRTRSTGTWTRCSSSTRGRPRSATTRHTPRRPRGWGRCCVSWSSPISAARAGSRAMLETLDVDRSSYVLLLDDDVVCEPEGIARAVAFADHARRPTIVGGHMFSMYQRSVLHAFAEVVIPWQFRWAAADPTRHDHDLATSNLRSTPWLHRRMDVDYNGWWMCLIPVDVLRDIGLSLPLFIKWDDAEYGLRAAAAEYRRCPCRAPRSARPVDGQGRQRGLAGVLPCPQPLRRRAAALALRLRRQDGAREPGDPGQAPAGDAVLRGSLAAAGTARRAGGAGTAAPGAAAQAGGGPAARAAHPDASGPTPRSSPLFAGDAPASATCSRRALSARWPPSPLPWAAWCARRCRCRARPPSTLSATSPPSTRGGGPVQAGLRAGVDHGRDRGLVAPARPRVGAAGPAREHRAAPTAAPRVAVARPSLPRRPGRPRGSGRLAQDARGDAPQEFPQAGAPPSSSARTSR